jgi:aminoglycoside phosphotransferase (APT) family kinase protein
MFDPARQEGFSELLTRVWPGAQSGSVELARISHHDHADHWLVSDRRYGQFVLRVARGLAAAERVEAALTALRGMRFAPSLLASSVNRTEGDHLIAMEYIEGVAPGVAETQARLGDFIDVIQSLHTNVAFGRAVESVGRKRDEDSSRRWAEEEWGKLQLIAPSDERVRRAAGWIITTRQTAAAESDQILVAGHGDLHAGNWRIAGKRLVLLDWEEIRLWSLASELADFVVFGHLEPSEVARRYGAPREYWLAVHNEAEACALSFYLYWLRTLLDGSDARPDAFGEISQVCARLFGEG